MAEGTDNEGTEKKISEAARINAQLKELLDDSKATLDEINAGLERQQKLTDDIYDSNKKTAKLNAEQLESEQKKIALKERADALLESVKKKEKELDDLYKAGAATREEVMALQEEYHEEAMKQLDEMDALEKSINATIKDRAELLAREDRKRKRMEKERSESQKKYTQEMKDNYEDQKEVADVLSEYSKEIPVIGNALSKAFQIKGNMKKFSSFLGDVGEAMGGKTGSSIANLGKFTGGAVKKFTTGAIAMSIAIFAAVGKLFKMGLAVDSLSKQLAAATGFGDVFNEEIITMARQGNMAGIGFQESADALGALTQGLSSFNPQAEATNVHVGMTVARLKKLGVESGAAVTSIDHMQRAMGMSAKQAADMTAQVARLGKEIGITGTKMINDFNAASGRLAIFGNNNIKVLKGLAAAAKATGIEMGSLISIAQQFDTFDKAADQAAKLNAVLGTQLSTLELMNASDEERIMMVKQQVEASVGNFDSLDKFTKMYIQQAMGVKDVAEAQRLLNMSTAEYQKYKQGQKEQADIQAEIAEATEKVVPLMQQLKLLGTQLFLAFAPIIQLFIPLIKGFTFLIRYIAKFIALVAPYVAIIAGIAFFIAKVVGGMTALVSVLNPVTAGILILLGLFTALFDIFSDTINPTFAQIFHFLSQGLMLMLSPLTAVISGVKAFGGVLGKLFGVAKDDAANMVNNDSFNLEAVAKIDMDRVSAGINKVKSALVELSNVKSMGMLAFTTDGSNTSMIMGSVATEMAMLLSGGKLEVDVKIPEMNMPKIDVKVYIGDRELRDIIRTEVSSVVGAAG